MIEIESPVDGDVVVMPRGNLDWVSATPLRHAVDDLLRLGLNFVVDLSRTDRVDATGISALVGTIRRAQAAGISACIVNARPSVQRQLDWVSLDQLVLCTEVFTGNDAA